jgi:HSP20 family protein
MLWNVDVWNEMDRLRREVNSLFSDFGQTGGTATYPLVNIYDNQDAIVVTAELPGLTKENVAITFMDGVLTLSGNLEPGGTVKNMAVVRQERSTGRFEKSVRIPSKIHHEKITAVFSNGILTITLPKSEEAKPKTITIDTK